MKQEPSSSSCQSLFAAFLAFFMFALLANFFLKLNLREFRTAPLLAVEEVPQEQCQRAIPVFIGDVVKHLRGKWFAFSRW
jgi:hypothetical protein